jgi:zinc protease
MPKPHYFQARPEPALADLPAYPPGVTLETLPNGLTLIVREDHSAPVVSAQAWCRTGSIHEGRWLGAGLSHVLEHMLFKGTATRGKGRIDQEIQAAGGSMNAYTSFDRTVYWINVPSEGCRVALDILADIMQHASLPEDELTKELEVIRREMDMGQDDPSRLSSRRLFETAYTVSPYRYTIIGYPDIFNELRREDVVSYYRERYTPNNLFFVVAGDIVAAEVIDQVCAAFSQTKARPLPPMVLPVEPAQTAPRELFEEAAIELGHVHFAWHIPDVRHPDVPLLDVLAVLLGGGRSSRLYQSVRERQRLVHSIDAWTYSPGSSGLLGISLLVDQEHLPAARGAVLEEVARLRAAPVSAGELTKAVKQFVAATWSARKTMQGQAQDLAHNWLTAADLNFSERYLRAVSQASVEDLHRAAQTYLTAENRTLFGLLPKGASPRTVPISETSTRQEATLHRLPNGLRLLIKEDHRLPFVECRAVFRGGVLAETAENNGITQLMGRLLLKGTTTRTAEQIASEIESVGGNIESYGANHSFGVNLEVLSEDFSTGWSVFADVLLHPGFAAEALEREREVQLAGIRAQRDQLLTCCFRQMRDCLFQGKHYGLDATGQEPSVQRLSRAEIVNYHERLAIPNNAVIAVYGDVPTDLVLQAAAASFGAWPQNGLPASPAPPEFIDGHRHLVERREKNQAVVVVGFPGVSLFDEDRYALDLVQEACSDLGSRLFLRIRDQLGLAYYVGAQNFTGLVPGFFAFYAGTAQAEAERVEAELFKELEGLRSDGLRPEELERSKAKIIGQRKIARQDLGGLALTHALDELYGLGYRHQDQEDERYAAITLDQVRETIQRHLNPARHVVSWILPTSPTAPTS